MSPVNFCRLCVQTCNVYERISDDSGHHNEIYDIAVQYFHPMFLNAGQEHQQHSVVCLDCWLKIYDFHKFQKTVVCTQINLLKGAAQTQAPVPFQVNIEPDLNHINAANGNGVTRAEDLGLHPPESKLIDGNFEQSSLKFKVMDNEVSTVEYNYSSASSSIALSVKEEDEDKAMDISITESFCGHFSSDDILVPESVTHTTDTQSNNSYAPKEPEEIILTSARIQIPPGNIGQDGARDGKRKVLQQLRSFLSQCQPNLMCAGCGYACTSLDKLQKHFRRREPNGMCHILCCQQKMERLVTITDHFYVHMDLNAFQCKLCGKCHTNEAQLYSHMYYQHPTSDGDHLRSPSKDSNRFDDFIAQWRPTLECPECNESSFPSFSLLREHFRHQHPIQQCYISCCQHNFPSQHKIKEHISGHHMLNTFKCEFSEKQYTNQSYFITHTIYHHANATLGYKVQPKFEYPCSICRGLYKDLADLRDHIGSHRGRDCHKCLHCTKSFRYSSGLSRHYKSEHPKYWFEKKIAKSPIIMQNKTD